MRCFVGIPIVGPVQAAVERLLRTLPRSPADLKPVAPHQLHITLKFLGELRDSNVPLACEIVRRASDGLSTFGIHVAGLGCFPNERAPRVLWAGVNDPAAFCRDWVHRADPEFSDIGVDAERRPYCPHVTLARVRSTRGGAMLRDWLNVASELSEVQMTVDRIVLYESRSGRFGPDYAPVTTILLGKP